MNCGLMKLLLLVRKLNNYIHFKLVSFYPLDKFIFIDSGQGNHHSQ